MLNSNFRFKCFLELFWYFWYLGAMYTFKHLSPASEEAQASVAQLAALSPAPSNKQCHHALPLTFSCQEELFDKLTKSKRQSEDLIYLQMPPGLCPKSVDCRGCSPPSEPHQRVSLQYQTTSCRSPGGAKFN